MMSKNTKIITILPILFFFLSFVLALTGFGSGKSVTLNILLFLTLASLIPLVYLESQSSRSVMSGFKHLLIIVLLTSIASRFIELRDMQSRFDHFIAFSWSFYSVVYIIMGLGILLKLILIRRKQYTAKNFNLFILILLFYALLGYEINGGGANFTNSKIFENIILFILINLMLINSFRVSWLGYLNKSQKLTCFWAGWIVIPLQWFITFRYFNMNFVEMISPILDRFVSMGALFMSVYLSIAGLALIGHLPTAKLFDQKMRQIQSLHNLSQAISTEFNYEKLVLLIVKLASEVTDSDFSWLELVDEKNRKPILVSSRNLDKTEKKLHKKYFHEKFYEYMKTNREPFRCNQVSKSKHAKEILLWKKELGSLLAVPLITGHRVIGILYAGCRVEFGFDQEDTAMLQAFSRQSVVAIENARLIEASVQKEKLEQELKIAHDAQMKLLPKQMPKIKGIEIDAVCQTANEVGGDYFDFIHLSDENLAVIVGDVSGKGASAAFYMAELKGIMGALSMNNKSPRQLLYAANKRIYENVARDHFISLIYAILSTKHKRITFCRAGHCPILLATKNSKKVQRIEPSGMGLGMDRGPLFEQNLDEHCIDLEPGMTLLLYTDGVIESRNKNGEEYGEKRLEETFAGIKNKSAPEIKSIFLNEINQFSDESKSYDDLTFVIIKIIEK